MPEDDTNEAARKRAEAARKRAEAARKRAEAKENTKQALKKLEKYIEDYKLGLLVCPEICELMNQYTDFQGIYPDIYLKCNCKKK